MPGSARARSVLPAPGGPVINTLCPPAAAISSARLACSCPRTSARSRTSSALRPSRTSVGLQVRGSLENPNLARACGISTSKLYALTFAFGAALAGLAGALIVPLYQLSADIGTRFLVQAFLSVMLGGVGTFEGPVLGAAAVGGMAAGLPWLVIPVLADPLVFVIALLIVKFRPQGFITQGRL